MMAEYKVLRTDTADAQLHQIILQVAENFGRQVALKKLDEIERQFLILEACPYTGSRPRYMTLRRQGYYVLILKKDLVFYKIDEAQKVVTIHAVVDQRLDYLNILRGL